MKVNSIFSFYDCEKDSYLHTMYGHDYNSPDYFTWGDKFGKWEDGERSSLYVIGNYSNLYSFIKTLYHLTGNIPPKFDLNNFVIVSHIMGIKEWIPDYTSIYSPLNVLESHWIG